MAAGLRRIGARSAALSVLVWVAGCGASAIPRPAAPDASWAHQQWPGTTLADLEQGRALYVDNCGGCHTLYSPQRVVAHAFPETFYEMAAEAHVTGPERDLIEHYLRTATR